MKFDFFPSTITPKPVLKADFPLIIRKLNVESDENELSRSVFGCTPKISYYAFDVKRKADGTSEPTAPDAAIAAKFGKLQIVFGNGVLINSKVRLAITEYLLKAVDINDFISMVQHVVDTLRGDGPAIAALDNCEIIATYKHCRYGLNIEKKDINDAFQIMRKYLVFEYPYETPATLPA